MLEFIINILSTPAILVGLMSLLGLALQRKPIEDIVKGTVKTIVGFLVLSAGASFLQSGSFELRSVICSIMHLVCRGLYQTMKPLFLWL